MSSISSSARVSDDVVFDAIANDTFAVQEYSENVEKNIRLIEQDIAQLPSLNNVVVSTVIRAGRVNVASAVVDRVLGFRTGDGREFLEVSEVYTTFEYIRGSVVNKQLISDFAELATKRACKCYCHCWDLPGRVWR